MLIIDLIAIGVGGLTAGAVLTANAIMRLRAMNRRIERRLR